MLTGIIQFSKDAYLRFTKGANNLDIKAPNTITNSYSVTFAPAPPGSTQVVTMDNTGQLGYASLGGSGTVSSVGLALPSIFTVTGSPVTSSGTLSATLQSQSANTILAAPSGAAGVPTFRALAWADVSGLSGTTATSFALGNDSRFHVQGTDTGTTATSFQLDSGNTGPRIKNTSGVLEIRNAGDTAFADIRVANLFVTGTTTTINSETISVNDNILQLNSNVTSGTPTEDLGLEGLRGAQTSASLKWVESAGRWMAGLLGTEIPLSRTFETTFTNASLTAGILTVNHNLNRRVVHVVVSDSTNKMIAAPDEITFTSVNQCALDFTSFGTLTGTWTVVVIG